MKWGHGSPSHSTLAGGEVIMWLKPVVWDHLALFSTEKWRLFDLDPSLEAPAPSESITSEPTDYNCYTSKKNYT